MGVFQFGSLQNEFAAHGRDKSDSLPAIGSGATLIQWTDRTPLTVVGIEFKGGVARVICREDSARRIDSNGFSESQEYEFTPNPNGRVFTFKRVPRGRKKGLWREGGLSDGNGVVFGSREKYHDFSF